MAQYTDILAPMPQEATLPSRDELLECFEDYVDEEGEAHIILHLAVGQGTRDKIVEMCDLAGIDIADFFMSSVAAIIAATENPQGICIIRGLPTKN